MEVMLGEAYRVITEVVGQACLRRDLAKHPVVGRAVESDLAVFYLRLVSNCGQIKERYFHASLNKCMSATVEPSSPTRQAHHFRCRRGGSGGTSQNAAATRRVNPA